MSKREQNFKTHVVFSAVGPPSSYCVFDSLKNVVATELALVITSRNYLNEWKSIGIATRQARYDSLSLTKKTFRKARH